MIKYSDVNGDTMVCNCRKIRVSSDNYDETGKKWYVSAKTLSDMARFPIMTNELLINLDGPFEVHASIENFDDESGIWRAHLVMAKPGNYKDGVITLDKEDVVFENYAVFADQGIKIEADGKSVEIVTGGLGIAAADPNTFDMMEKKEVGEEITLGNIICTCASLKKNEGSGTELIDIIIAFTGKLGFMKERFPELIESLTGKMPEKKNVKTD